MADRNATPTLVKLVDMARWVRETRAFTAEQFAGAHGVSRRTAYRYLNALLELDPALEGSAGVGYLYRPARREVIPGITRVSGVDFVT